MLVLLREDPAIVTSAFTIVEIASALWRRRHNGELSLTAHDAAEQLYAQISERWTELTVSGSVIAQASSILSRHRLGAGDALQLAAASLASGSSKLPFVSLDTDLSAAARAEGFTVLS